MPQREAQLMDVMPEEAAEQENRTWPQYRENGWCIIATFTAMAYIAYALDQYASLDEIPFHNQTGEIEYCTLDTNRIMRHFLEWILLPTLLYRLVAQYKYRDHGATEYLDFKEFYLYVRVFCHGTYGCWTLYNLQRYFGVPRHCKELGAMSLVNFEMAMIIGCWSAVTVLFFTVIIAILIPIALYAIWKNARAR